MAHYLTKSVKEKTHLRMHFLGQAVMQAAGLIYAAIKYRKKYVESIDHFTPKVEYILPFAGEWYTANGGITKNTSHSWDILAQRFAYDFIIVDEKGGSYHGDKKDLQSYYCYGKDILAPADGLVVSFKNDFPDCRIMNDGQTDPESPDIGGNRITIKHAANEYSTICHLMPKSVIVEIGQRVRKGEVVAKCGNSGNTTEPHVHFQVQNTAHFYSCMGLPVFFGNIQKKICTEYELIDTRPMPQKNDTKEGYIHRGLLVEQF